MAPRYGIHTARAFGVSVANIRALGKELGRDHAMAPALWDTGWYEARMLAAFVDEPALVTAAQMDRWCRDFDNWAICDTVCFHLFDRTPHAWAKVTVWSGKRAEFVRRALGLFGGPSTNLPMFFRTVASANVAAGVYTDTITIQWVWDYCTGVGLLGVCLGKDQGSGTSSFQVTMTVTNACQVSSAPDVALGHAPIASSFTPVSQSLSVCTTDLAVYTVGLSAGQHACGESRITVTRH